MSCLWMSQGGLSFSRIGEPFMTEWVIEYGWGVLGTNHPVKKTDHGDAHTYGFTIPRDSETTQSLCPKGIAGEKLTQSLNHLFCPSNLPCLPD